jgi:hypothetical protein
MAIRNRLRKRPRAEPEPVQLSCLLLGLHGVFVLARVRRPGPLPVDVVGVDRAGFPVLAAVVTPAERFGALLALLGDAAVGKLVHGGSQILVLSWSRGAGGCHVGKVIRLVPDDFKG